MSSIKAVSLRRATVADAAAIAAVRIEGWQTSYRGIMPDSYLDNMQLADSLLHWKQILQALPQVDARVCVYVAESEGAVIGFASGMLLEPAKLGMQGELTAVYLLPQWQRAGIGRRLLQKVARTLQAQGAQNLLVWVIADNAPARNFCEELGALALQEQAFSWDGLDLTELAYGWRDLAVLEASVLALPTSPSLH
ncbi:MULTISPECIES: GNAT family N-acetyltransferase [unclassified Undibacterium]|nr:MULTISPECIES: GNAT family N-acetyltransferase [unclassified Undibacterium]MEB0139100.1 GNAT family N-acetyltransferase [Undibacterium sp. CCC2.1]MEB0173441.1 GNAT family N-acetyltransferase [Undibacterium sp. CCC1.1]MEB0177175.1 GNAT family N-acetyltransferase [Undibacterium sp. CCC3.4]MEB0216440.1 GNAT family N-acetyltransferase [Undibacterium sp. 5I2]WPX42064.1 GNAT family N-acetyltransferase [Undibacterium sp. CCC3.4]